MVMQYGLIGKHLGHSWSKEIHSTFFPNMSYACMEISSASAVHDFLRRRAFSGLNVTIPYKRTVLKDLDQVEASARMIGAVNCIVKRNQKLYGYNTDYIGLRDMLRSHFISLQNQMVAILGTGGAARCAAYVVCQTGGHCVYVSRHPGRGMISYEELYQKEDLFSILIQATPIGMFPNDMEVVIDLQRLPSLSTVIDLVANPLRTRLQFDAKKLGKKYIGGFEMLVRQAAKADEYFWDTIIEEEAIQKCIVSMLHTRRNIVLIGMPSSGKTTIAARLGEVLHKPVVSMDGELEKQFEKPIRQVFAENGEAVFRQAEEALAVSLRKKTGCVIATGGGIIHSPLAMQTLWGNGIFVWLDRDLKFLQISKERPLSATKNALHALYVKRYPLYAYYSDVHIKNNGTIDEAVKKIQKKVGHAD